MRSPVVIICTTSRKIKKSALCPLRVFMSCIILEQDRQCTFKCNVEAGSFAVEKQQELNVKNNWLYPCLRYPACNAHASYYIVICSLFGRAFRRIFWPKRDGVTGK